MNLKIELRGGTDTGRFSHLMPMEKEHEALWRPSRTRN